MNILLLQNDNCIRDLSEDVMARYPRSAVMSTNGSEFPRERPILCGKWLIRVKLGRRMNKQIEMAKKSEGVANFIFVYQGSPDAVTEMLRRHEVDYQTVNNLKPDLDLLIAYVKNQLGIVDSIAQHIVNRSNRYEPLVVKNVMTLSLVKDTNLTRTVVDKYLRDSSIVSFSYFYRYVLLGEGDYRKVVKLVYYQNTTDALCRFMVRRLTQDIHLFEEIMDGVLCKSNYVSYAEQSKVSLSSVQQALVLFEKVTVETLLVKVGLYSSLVGCKHVDFVMKGCRV